MIDDEMFEVVKPDKAVFGKKINKNGSVSWVLQEMYKAMFESFDPLTPYYADICVLQGKKYITKIITMPSGFNHQVAKSFFEIYDGLNFGLAWDKYPEYRNDKFHLLNENRTALSNLLNNASRSEALMKPYIKAFNARNQLINDSIKGIGFDEVSFTASTKWRMAIGMGEQHVLENNVTLHKVFGIPYIPGSSIKGVMRAYIIKNYFQNNESDALKCQDFRRIFGSALGEYGQRGTIYFGDAIPNEPPHYAADVMTVHYPEYYQSEGAIPANDWESPNPIYFLTIEKTAFNVSCFIEKRPVDGINLNGNMFKSVKELILGVFPTIISEFGIGAKTRKGYGKMKFTHESNPT
ncbi:MAG TPA: type III-B CRISPR module RAMP protein Cmr6 [Chitinophagales bacterium]|nr:type III-B CRISPR module RAMP protein Cmr6 [Chitinophagales bacterium]